MTKFACETLVLAVDMEFKSKFYIVIPNRLLTTQKCLIFFLLIIVFIKLEKHR